MADETPKIGKIEIDREKCISVATCVAVDPDTYELDDEGKAIIKDPRGTDDAKILEGAKSCPVNAVIVYDTEGKKLWPEE